MSESPNALSLIGIENAALQKERLQIWQERIEQLSFALQPIVHIHNGELFAVEALIRDFQLLGFSSASSLFDAIATDGLLYPVELALRQKALEQFKKLPGAEGLKLFYNLDSRSIESGAVNPGGTAALVKKMGLTSEHLCFEISERHQFPNSGRSLRLVAHYQSQQFQVALDDFGSGYAGLSLLYTSQPDYLKIDRFFISQVFAEPKKKLFLSKMVNLAHLLGIKVIAEGVETEKEYFVCREMGCDYAQGFLIAHPTTKIESIEARSSVVSQLVAKDRRKNEGAGQWLLAQIESLPPVSVHTSMLSVLDLMRHHNSISHFPVIDNQQRPLGLLCEEDLKQYVYSPFGRELMQNRSTGLTVSNFVQDCPTVALDSPPEVILEVYAQAEGAKGLLITEQGRYLGFLSSNRLLKLLHERNLAAARDSNPLTGLPGNHRISRFIQQHFSDKAPDMFLVYFDFDNFKPFNDKEGFRKGDRAILLFADLMGKLLGDQAALLGHIGGDDFFAALKGTDYLKVLALVQELQQTFKRDVESFYDAKARELGYIEGKNREGKTKRFPLLAVSAAILQIRKGTGGVNLERISEATALLKKGAKAAENGLSSASLNPKA